MILLMCITACNIFTWCRRVSLHLFEAQFSSRANINVLCVQTWFRSHSSCKRCTSSVREYVYLYQLQLRPPVNVLTYELQCKSPASCKFVAHKRAANEMDRNCHKGLVRPWGALIKAEWNSLQTWVHLSSRLIKRRSSFPSFFSVESDQPILTSFHFCPRYFSMMLLSVSFSVCKLLFMLLLFISLTQPGPQCS